MTVHLLTAHYKRLNKIPKKVQKNKKQTCLIFIFKNVKNRKIMSLPGLIRDRNSGKKRRRLEVYGRNRFLQEYRSYHADCLRIDADALPAALAFHPTAQQDILLIADDKGKK